MAKILLGATIGDARGSAGAIVYSKNQFGAYIRQKVSPVQPRTARQTLVRQLFSTLAIRWGSALSVAERAAWLSLAAVNPVTDVFGNSQILTGLQFYMRVNRNLQSVGFPVIDAAPADHAVTPLSGYLISSSVATQSFELAFGPDPIPANHSLLIFATAPLSPGKSFFKPLLRFIDYKAAGTASGWDDGAPYVARFGAMQLGQRLGSKAYLINTTNGAASSDLFANCIVAA